MTAGVLGGVELFSRLQTVADGVVEAERVQQSQTDGRGRGPRQHVQSAVADGADEHAVVGQQAGLPGAASSSGGGGLSGALVAEGEAGLAVADGGGGVQEGPAVAQQRPARIISRRCGRLSAPGGRSVRPKMATRPDAGSER